MKSTEPDLSDARWLRRTRWVHPKRLMSAFPEHKELIETVGRYGGSWWQQPDVCSMVEQVQAYKTLGLMHVHGR